MILAASHLVTGDGKTHLQNAALRLETDGRIGFIGSREEMKHRYPEDAAQDLGRQRSFRDCSICTSISAITTASRISEITMIT